MPAPQSRPWPPRSGRPADLARGRALGWAIATVVGFAVAGFVFHFPGSLDGSWDPTALVFGTLFGGMSGLVVGLLQAIPLRGAVARPGRHLWAIGVIVGGTHGVYDGVRDFGPLLQVGAGIFAALVVWLLLAERRTWVLAGVAAGWSVGLLAAAWATRALGMPWEETPVGWSTEHLVAGIVVGAIFAGAVLMAGFPGMVSSARTDARAVTDSAVGST